MRISRAAGILCGMLLTSCTGKDSTPLPDAVSPMKPGPQLSITPQSGVVAASEQPTVQVQAGRWDDCHLHVEDQGAGRREH